jgi:hypothetical protein
MRVRDHLALSTAATAMSRPFVGRRALGLWAGSVLIDADHYVWFCLRQRRLSPAAAIRYFNGANVPRHPAMRALHTPFALLAVLLIAAWQRALLPVAVGMSAHVALDAHYEARMDQARAAALARDRFSCQSCGVTGPHLGTHIQRQPWLLPSYEAQNLVSLCSRCHELAHNDEPPSGSWN